MNPVDRLTHYQIRILGQLDQRWLRWFDGLLITYQPQDETLISGAMDQAALHGVLNRIRDLGLELISVQQIPPRTGPELERNHA